MPEDRDVVAMPKEGFRNGLGDIVIEKNLTDQAAGMLLFNLLRSRFGEP